MSDSSLQYTTAKDGSVMGVTVTNHGMVTHCRTLTQACSYTEGMRCDHNSHFLVISCWSCYCCKQHLFCICLHEFSAFENENGTCPYPGKPFRQTWYMVKHCSTACMHVVYSHILNAFMSWTFSDFRWSDGLCIRFQKRNGPLARYTFGMYLFSLVTMLMWPWVGSFH